MNAARIVWAVLLAAGCGPVAASAAETSPAPRRRSARKKVPTTMQPTRSIVYKKTTNADGSPVALSLHIFEPAGQKPSQKRPAIVFFFGGGWVGGTPSQFYPHCRYLASRGMLAISAEYRVRSRNGTTPFECVADGADAIRYVRAHAAELGVDPDRIAAGGGSAGGHVAAATGTLPSVDAAGKRPSGRPNAMVLFNPVINCSPDGSYGYRQVRDRWREICPTHNVGPATPPTILLHGKADTTVRYADAEGFARKMKAAGARCELVGYEGQKHGFFNFGRGGNENFIRTVEAADRFLASLGYLRGEPTVRQFVRQQTGAAAEPPDKP